jgi:starch synthase (maltosyl-transferring)
MQDGRSRVVIENVKPQVNCGMYPIKRVVGGFVVVEVDAFADGHDVVAVELRYRSANDTEWSKLPMRPLVNDRWTAEFKVDRLGEYHYCIAGWVDHFATWSRDFKKRVDAGQVAPIDLQVGAGLVHDASIAAKGPDRERLEQFREKLHSD